MYSFPLTLEIGFERFYKDTKFLSDFQMFWQKSCFNAYFAPNDIQWGRACCFTFWIQNEPSPSQMPCAKAFQGWRFISEPSRNRHRKSVFFLLWLSYKWLIMNRFVFAGGAREVPTSVYAPPRSRGAWALLTRRKTVSDSTTNGQHFSLSGEHFSPTDAPPPSSTAQWWKSRRTFREVVRFLEKWYDFSASRQSSWAST